jgi:hypothetical protein
MALSPDELKKLADKNAKRDILRSRGVETLKTDLGSVDNPLGFGTKPTEGLAISTVKPETQDPQGLTFKEGSAGTVDSQGNFTATRNMTDQEKEDQKNALTADERGESEFEDLFEEKVNILDPFESAKQKKTRLEEDEDFLTKKIKGEKEQQIAAKTKARQTIESTESAFVSKFGTNIGAFGSNAAFTLQKFAGEQATKQLKELDRKSAAFDLSIERKELERDRAVADGNRLIAKQLGLELDEIKTNKAANDLALSQEMRAVAKAAREEKKTITDDLISDLGDSITDLTENELADLELQGFDVNRIEGAMGRVGIEKTEQERVREIETNAVGREVLQFSIDNGAIAGYNTEALDALDKKAGLPAGSSARAKVRWEEIQKLDEDEREAATAALQAETRKTNAEAAKAERDAAGFGGSFFPPAGVVLEKGAENPYLGKRGGHLPWRANNPLAITATGGAEGAERIKEADRLADKYGAIKGLYSTDAFGGLVLNFETMEEGEIAGAQLLEAKSGLNLKRLVESHTGTNAEGHKEALKEAGFDIDGVDAETTYGELSQKEKTLVAKSIAKGEGTKEGEEFAPTKVLGGNTSEKFISDVIFEFPTAGVKRQEAIQAGLRGVEGGVDRLNKVISGDYRDELGDDAKFTEAMRASLKEDKNKARLIANAAQDIKDGNTERAKGKVFGAIKSQMLAQEARTFEGDIGVMTDMVVLSKAFDKVQEKTGIAVGSLEKLQEKMGGAFGSDPELASLMVDTNRIIQKYTKAQSGAQFSVQEFERYKALLPDIFNNNQLNQAKIKGFHNSLTREVDNIVSGRSDFSIDTLREIVPNKNAEKIYFEGAGARIGEDGQPEGQASDGQVTNEFRKIFNVEEDGNLSETGERLASHMSKIVALEIGKAGAKDVWGGAKRIFQDAILDKDQDGDTVGDLLIGLSQGFKGVVELGLAGVTGAATVGAGLGTFGAGSLAVNEALALGGFVIEEAMVGINQLAEAESPQKALEIWDNVIPDGAKEFMGNMVGGLTAWAAKKGGAKTKSFKEGYNKGVEIKGKIDTLASDAVTKVKETVKGKPKADLKTPTLEKLKPTIEEAGVIKKNIEESTAKIAAAEETLIEKFPQEKVKGDFRNVAFSKEGTVKKVIDKFLNDKAETVTEGDLMRRSQAIAEGMPAGGKSWFVADTIRKFVMKNTSKNYKTLNDQYAVLSQTINLIEAGVKEGNIKPSKLKNFKKLPPKFQKELEGVTVENASDVLGKLEALRTEVGTKMNTEIKSAKGAVKNAEMQKELSELLESEAINVKLETEIKGQKIQDIIKENPQDPQVVELIKERQALEGFDKGSTAISLDQQLFDKTGTLQLGTVKKLLKQDKATPEGALLREVLKDSPELLESLLAEEVASSGILGAVTGLLTRTVARLTVGYNSKGILKAEASRNLSKQLGN